MSEATTNPVCAACDEDLSAWIDGELAEWRAREIRLHVAACARCRPRVAALRSVDGALRGLASAPPTGSEVTRLERLEARLLAARQDAREAGFRRESAARAIPMMSAPPIGAPRRRPRRRWTPGLAGLAAVALAVVVVPILLERAASRSPEPSGRDGTARNEAIVMESAARETVPSVAPDLSPAAIPRPQSMTPGRFGASAPEDPLAGSGSETDAAVAPSDFGRADLPLIERLDALEALPRIQELPPAERRRLAERLAAPDSAAASDRERLRDNVLRWREMPAPQREALRQRWLEYQALPEPERARLLGPGSSLP